jgi:hypothetical protein
MEPGSKGSAEAPRPISSHLGDVEGYSALALTILLLLVPGPPYQTTYLLIALLGIASGLALGGSRFGKGGGCIAARFALAILSLLLIGLVVRGILLWDEVRQYWWS